MVYFLPDQTSSGVLPFTADADAQLTTYTAILIAAAQKTLESCAC